MAQLILWQEKSIKIIMLQKYSVSKDASKFVFRFFSMVFQKIRTTRFCRTGAPVARAAKYYSLGVSVNVYRNKERAVRTVEIEYFDG